METGPRRRKGEITRQALMDAGFRVFAEKGFLRAQIGDIVGAAGKSSGVFYLHFRNKDELLDAWVDECDRMAPWFQADTSLLFEKARGFVLQSYWSLYETFGPIIEALAAAALVSDHFNARWTALREKADAGVAHMIRHAQAEGRCVGMDAALTAAAMGAMLSSTAAYWFRNRAALEARGVDQATAIAHLDALYTQMLDRDAIVASGGDPVGRPGDAGGLGRASLPPARKRASKVATAGKA